MTTPTIPLPSGTTRVAGVIGHPVGHSLSPLLLNTAFAATGVNWIYGAFDVDTGGARGALEAMRLLDLAGFSVTMPLKEEVAGLVDTLSATAARLGAVNCVTNVDGTLTGHSTDGDGLIDSLRVDEGFEPEGKVCVVVGAGGAARAAVSALADVRAAEVIVVNRTAARAAQAAALAGDRGNVGDQRAIARADLVVQATPVGMGSADELPFDPDLIGDHQFVFDMVYLPLRSTVVRAAAERGAHAVGGLGMLVHQAAHAFTLWTGLEAPISAMSDAARSAVERGRG